MTKASRTERSFRYIQSVRALHDLLLAHSSDLAVIDSRIMKSCQSQGMLAKLDAPDLSIHGMSLNTLKTVSDNHLSGGFLELDRLRRLVARNRKSRKPIVRDGDAPSATPARSEMADLRNQRQSLINSCAFMADQYNDLLSIYRRTLDRLERGRAEPANERRLLEGHLSRFRGPKGQPMVLVDTTDKLDSDDAT